MAFVVLTRSNVAALKSALLSSYPEVKSGHADEALAASFGFKTHAALLASLKAQGSSRLTVFVSDVVLKRRLEEIAGIKVLPEGDAWQRIWRHPLPDQSDTFGMRAWFPTPANEN